MADILMIGAVLVLVACCLAISVCAPLIDGSTAPECCGAPMEPEPERRGWRRCAACGRTTLGA